MTVAAGGTLRKIALSLLTAMILSACAGVTIGPVDTSCHVNPARGMGSGCGGGH